MARINTVNKSRKEKVCGGCGKLIPVGSKYFYVDFYSGRTAIRCASCGFKPYETTENPYLQELYRIQYDYSNRLNELTPTSEEAPNDVKDDLVSELESLRDEVQERFDNIPEQLQDGDAGSLLQERIDSLDEAISDIDSEDLDSFEYWRDDEGYGEDDFASWLEDNGYDTEDEKFDEESAKSDFESEAEEKYQEAIDDFVSNVQDSLDNIAE